MLDELMLQFDYEWREGNRSNAVNIAKEFISIYRQKLEPELMRYTRDELVKLVEAYRSAGRHSDRMIADMWLLSEYEPQNITGDAYVTVKIPASTSTGLKLVE